MVNIGQPGEGAWGAAKPKFSYDDVVRTVVEYEQKQTGSWYAHSKNDKLWLDRLLIRKADGELTTLNLDDYSHVEILTDEPAAATGPAKTNESELPL